MEEENNRLKTKEFKIWITVLIISIVLIVGGVATGIGIFVSDKNFNENDITIFINEESCDTYSVYAGSSTIKIVPKLKNKTTGFAASFIIEDESSDCVIDETGNFTPGLKACDTIVKVSIICGNQTLIKNIVITIKDRGLKAIEASYVPKNKYIEGQKFETGGLVITGVFELGMSTVTGYEVSDTLSLVPDNTSITITYTENGVTVSTAIPITVAPKTLQGVRITKRPAKTEYIEGDTFKTDGMEVTALYEYISLPISEYSVSNTHPLALTDSAVYISYTEGDITKSATVEINVIQKSLQSISVTHNPDKTDYVEGQIFNAKGLEITAYFEFTNFVVSDYTLSNTTYLCEADTKLTITYTYGGITKSTEIELTITPKTLLGLTIKTPPDKVAYIEGEIFDAAGLSVVADYDYFSEQITEFNVTPNRQLLDTDTEIELSYTHGGISKSQTISIIVRPKTLQRISVSTLPTKTTYIEGQSFDKSGMVITAYYEFVEREITEYSVDVANILLVGNEAVTISYTENNVSKNVTFVLTISKKTLQGLTVTKLPDKLNYIEGQTFDSTGSVITAEYEYLSYDITNYSTDLTEPLMPMDTEVVYSYTDGDITKTVCVDINVTERTLQEIKITTLPDTTAYIEGETFDSSGMVITAIYEYKSLSIQGFTVDTVTPLTLTDCTRTISYTENGVTKTADLELIISANLLECLIIDSSATKTEYSVGEYLNTSGLKVTACYTDGTNRLVTGWRADKTEVPLTVGDTEVKISYTDSNGRSRVTKSAQYDITVEERELVGIEITSMPEKLNYVAGEFFSSAGLIVTAKYSGNQSQVISDYTLSLSGRALTESDTSITITYKENSVTKTVAFNIFVDERVLTSLITLSEPDKTNYKNTEIFDAKGLVVAAVYNNDAYSKIITTYTIVNSRLPLSIGDEFITISYTENAVTKTTEIAITITARTLSAIEITSSALKLNYIEGEYFDILGLTVTAHYEDAADSIVTAWTYDKTGMLTVDDNAIIVSYSEDGISKTTQFEISVEVSTIIDEAIQEVIKIINALPNVDKITLDNEAAVSYANELFYALEPEKQIEVKNSHKLFEVTKKIIELFEELPPHIEPVYNISYLIYGDLNFIDITMGNNPTQYRNSDEPISLECASSKVAILSGFVFTGWIDGDDLSYVTEIKNLTSDKVYYAVFSLTETVNIKFIDYDDKATELYNLDNISRLNMDGNYSFDLTDYIGEAIKNIYGKIAVDYYLLNKESETTLILGGIPTDYAATIIVYVKAVSLRELKLENELDASLSWIYNYIDDKNISRSEYRSYNGEANFYIPIGAIVTLFANNPLLVDFSIDGKNANMLYPARDYSFLLEEGQAPLVIGFQYNQLSTKVITFKGVNTKIFTFDTKTWNGLLSASQLNEIEFIFDEDNFSYLNIYDIQGTEYYFSQLGEYVFDGDTLINVKRIENKFNLTFVYSGGTFAITNLKGRQTIGEAVLEKGLTADIGAVYDAVWSKLNVYADYERSIAIGRTYVEAEMLLSDITLFIAERQTFDLTIANYDMHGVHTVNVSGYIQNADYNLRDELYDLEHNGYLVDGISLTDGGEIISDVYIEVILQNLNSQADIFVKWVDDPNYMAPLPEVDYHGNEVVGVWSATYNNYYGLITADFTFNPEGTYTYVTYVNGNVSANISGEYRLESNDIVIYSLKLNSEYQIITLSMLNIDISFVNDNLLIVSMFIIDDMMVTAYDHVLTKGSVRPANYLQNEILGKYTRRQITIEADVKTEQITTINFYANGTVLVTIELNGSIIFLENSYYRIIDSRIIFMSNSDWGVTDFTESLRSYVKEVQDYSLITSVGWWVAADNESWEFANLVEISPDGIITSYSGESGIGANLSIMNSSNYTVVLDVSNELCYLEIELVNGSLRVLVNNLTNGTAELLVFNRA